MSSPTLLRAYTVPLVLGALSIGGLVLALIGDGAMDVVAVALAVVPLVALARIVFRRSATTSSPPATRIP